MNASGESVGRNGGAPEADRLSMGQAEAARMRNSLVLLIFLGSLSCARLQRMAAPAPRSGTDTGGRRDTGDLRMQ